MTSLSEHYFGELEAFDEATLHQDFFKKTFVAPSSLSISSLKNDRKFIILGRKGVGKTAVQFELANQLRSKGFFIHHFRFFYDIRSDDYKKIATTQNDVSFASATNQKSLFLHYDFRDVWERVFFQRIATKITEEGRENPFTKFVNPNKGSLSNIFDGIARSLSIKATANFGAFSAEVGFDLERYMADGEVPLNIYNKITRELFKKYCMEFQFYFFVDELVFSRLDAKEDEITLRAAMVRDIVRTVWELNSFAAINGMEFHFICSLRPEVRNLINDLDSEAGKYLDAKDVELNWITTSTESRSLIYDVLVRKVEYSGLKPVVFNSFFDSTISFNDRKFTIEQFLRENTWGRPRDVVRLLLAIQKKSPNALNISEPVIKAGLTEYSRMSLKELVDELGVSFGPKVLDAIKNGVRKKIYKDSNELWDALKLWTLGINKDRFIKELFNLGAIGGYTPHKGGHHWSYRGETYLKPDHKIMIHAGLWNELSIRST